MAARIAVLALSLVSAAPALAAAQGELQVLPGGPGDHLGVSLAALPDVDQDGAGDVVVGSLDFAMHTGYAKLVSGRTGAVLHTFTHPAGGTVGFGYSVGSAGDTNGDGMPDLIVGRNSSNDVGNAWVYSGSGALIQQIQAPAVSPALYGIAVGGAGDIDGDGRDDVMVGAAVPAPILGTGRVDVIRMPAGAVLFSIQQQAPDDGTGFSVSRAGDVDADGHPDLLIGSMFSDQNGADSGLARIFSGADGTLLRTIKAGSAGGLFGLSCTDAGDWNGDGYDDVAIAAPLTKVQGVPSGGVWVFSGATGLILKQSFGAAGSNHGMALDASRDFDGDGRRDLVIGEPAAAPSGPDSGRVVVVSGAASATLLTIDGALAGGTFGQSAAALDDVNGDGAPDLAIGAPEFGVSGPVPEPPDLQGGELTIHSSRCGTATVYAPACAGALAAAPRLTASGCFTPGGTFALAVEYPSGATLAALLLAAVPGSVALPNGCALGLALPANAIALPLDGGGAVHWSGSLPIPAPLGTVHVQGLVFDAASGHGTTEAIAVTID